MSRKNRVNIELGGRRKSAKSSNNRTSETADCFDLGSLLAGCSSAELLLSADEFAYLGPSREAQPRSGLTQIES